MGSRKMWVTGVTLGLGLSLLAAGCGGSGGGGGGSKLAQVKLASISPLQGSQSDIGESIKNGAALAFADREADLAKAGYQVTHVYKDDEAKPEIGTQVAQQVLDDKGIIGVVGTFNSGVAIPVSEVLLRDNVVMVSPANTATAVTDRGLSNMNRICARDDRQGPAGAEYAVNNLGAKKIFLIHDKTDYGQPIAQEFGNRATALGAEIVGTEGINPGDVDFNSVLTSVAAKNPDLVYFGGIYPEAAQIVKQMREKGIQAKFMGADGIDSGDMAKLAGKDVVGVYYTTVAASPYATAEGKAFVDRYKAKFGKEPIGFAVMAYDAAQVLVNNLIKYGEGNQGKVPSRAEFAQLVRGTKDMKGLVTTTTFDGNGDNEHASVFIFEFTSDTYPGEQIGAN